MGMNMKILNAMKGTKYSTYHGLDSTAGISVCGKFSPHASKNIKFAAFGQLSKLPAYYKELSLKDGVTYRIIADFTIQITDDFVTDE
jgi:hypothetical protein